MPAPLGNQNAVGNQGGRPGRDLEDLANKLIAWSELDTSTNLNGFCGLMKMDPVKVSLYARENVEFRSAFNKAKANLAQRREDLLSQNRLHVKAYDLNAAVYDHFLKEEKREQLAYESSLKQQETSNASDDQKEHNQKVLDQLSELQKDYSSRKSASKSQSKDNKS